MSRISRRDDIGGHHFEWPRRVGETGFEVVDRISEQFETEDQGRHHPLVGRVTGIGDPGLGNQLIEGFPDAHPPTVGHSCPIGPQ